jgi:proline iminopeptidase
MPPSRTGTKLVSNGTTQLHVTEHHSNITEEDENCSSTAETVLLLHGGPGVPDDFPYLVERLTPKYRVLTFHQRGTGNSANPSGNYTMDAYVSDIDSILDYFELTKVHLFGHSWGGLYAQIYAEAHPEKIASLFLCSPSSGTNELWIQTETAVLAFNQSHCRSEWEFLKMGWYSLMGGMFGFDYAYRSLFLIVLGNYNRLHGERDISPEAVQHVKAAPINGTRPNIVKYKALATMKEEPSFSIVITYGDKDIYGVSSEAVPLRYPTAKHHVIANCGHIPWWHNPEDFELILKSFYSL